MTTHDITLRRATSKDILEIAKVHHDSAYDAYKGILDDGVLYEIFGLKAVINDWKSYLEKADKDNSLIPIVAIEDGKVVGVLRANIAANDEASLLQNLGHSNHKDIASVLHVKNIYISPSAQRKSVGKKMLNKVSRMGKMMGCKKAMTITLNGYESSPKFFQKIGDAALIGDMSIDVSVMYKSLQNAPVLNFNVWDMPCLDSIIARTAERKLDRVDIVGIKMQEQLAHIMV